MPRRLYANNAVSTLAVAVTSTGQATLTLQTGHGERFPSPLSPYFFEITLDDGVNIEQCYCIARSGDVLTVLRGQEGSTAQAAFAIGTQVALRMTSGAVYDLRDASFFDTARNIPVTGVASVSWEGMPVPTAVSCVTAWSMANSNYADAQPQVHYRTPGSSNGPLQLRQTVPNISGQRGYRARVRFGLRQVPNSFSFFVGWVNTTGQVSSIHSPASLTNAIAVGVNAGNNTSELSFWRNDGAGSAVSLACGSFFTVRSDNFYEFEIYAQPGASRIDYRLRNLGVASVTEISSFFTTDIPPNSLWLSSYMHGFTGINSVLWVRWGGWGFS